jgi:YidC/Oxa1 family membrane protein insertase
MGVQTMDPKMLKAMTWGLPAISLIATSFLPAGLQLSFFVSGLLSGAQATLLRQPWFRNRFDMVPMPTKPKSSTTTSPPSPYKGTLKRVSAGPLSTTELGSRFEGPKAGLQKTVGQIREMEPPSKATGIFGAPIKSVKGVVESIKDAAQGPIDMAKERMEKNKLKDLAREREAYEKKRQEEIKKSKAEQERKQRAERRARRAMQNKEQ